MNNTTYKVICKHCGREKSYRTPYKWEQKIHKCFNCGSEDLTVILGEYQWVSTMELNYKDGKLVDCEAKC